MPVDAQRASRRLPELDRFVQASTGHLLTIRTEGNALDIAVKCSIVSTHHTFENKQEYETAVTYHECPLTGHVGLAPSTIPNSHVQSGLFGLQNC